MRTIVANIFQNNGTTSFGKEYIISTNIISIDRLGFEVDSNLTKLTPGAITIKVADTNDVIWNFLQTQLSIAGGTLPPFIQLVVGGTQVFIGVIDLSNIQQHLAADDHSVEIGAQDWSIELSNLYLGSPTALPWAANKAYAVGNQVLNGSNIYTCITAGTSSTTGLGPQGIINSIQDGTCYWAYVPPAWQRPLPIAAANTGITGQSGYSNNNYYISMGSAPSNVVMFTDPCSWIYNGAVVTQNQPVLNLTVPNYIMGAKGKIGPQGTFPSAYYPVGMVVENDSDDYGTSFWTVTNNGIVPYTGPFTGVRDNFDGYPSCAPLTVDQLWASSPWFLPGMLVLDTQTGYTWQVTSQTGNGGMGTWTRFNGTIPTLGNYYKVVTFQDQLSYLGGAPGSYASVTLNATPWPNIPYLSGTGTYSGYYTSTFSLFNPTAADLTYWTTLVPVPTNPSSPIYQIYLNSVNGIVTGDKIQIVDSNTSSSWTVAGVDPIMCCVNTVEPVSGLPIGTHIYWDQESQAEYVLEDPRKIIPMLTSQIGKDPDLTRFIAPTTTMPMFGWLPLRSANGDDLYAVGDIEPGLTGLRVMTGANAKTQITGVLQPIPNYSWTGTPDSGWTQQTPVGTVGAPHADWTSQLLSAPSALMPYEVTSLNIFQRLRNRAYSDSYYRRENNGVIQVNGNLVNGVYAQTTNTNGVITYQYVENGTTYYNSGGGDNFNLWSPVGANTSGTLTIYDYTQMKRYIFNGNSVQVNSWVSNAWGSNSNYTWPTSISGQASYIQSAVPMIGTAGAVMGYAVTTGPNNSISLERLELWSVGGALLANLTVPPSLIGGTLVSTPYGVYLVSGSCIALLKYTAGVITPTILYLVDIVDIIFPNTLTAISASQFLIFGRNDTEGTQNTTETIMMIINTGVSNTLDASVLWSEKICEGVPTTIGCVRDPSKAGRIVGHFGGALWQVDTQRPFCLDRFTPGGMTAADCLDHICQVFNAIAVPDAFGTLHIISRVNTDTPTALTMPVIKKDTTLSWKDFASIVRVTSSDGNYYYDSYGQQGGCLMEVDNQPMIWSLSGCAGMGNAISSWFGKPRTISEQIWFYSDPNTAAPWESLLPFQLLTLNGPAVSKYSSFANCDGATSSFTLSAPSAPTIFNPVISSLTRTDWQGGSRTNLLTYSNNPSNSSWNNNNDLIITGGVMAPDGTNTAYTCVANTTNYYHTIGQLFTYQPNTNYTRTIYLKAAGYSYVEVQTKTLDAVWHGVYINLATGIITSTANIISSSITSMGNGWYKVTATYNSGTGATGSNDAVLISPDGVNWSYAGDGVSGVSIWHSQLEVGSNSTNYINTYATPVTVYDGVSNQLVTTPRTNIQLHSQLFNGYWGVSNATILDNQTIAPDGTNTAAKLTDNATNTAHLICYAINTITANTTYAYSIYLKGGTKTKGRMLVCNNAASSGFQCNFDLTAGTAVAASNVGSGVPSGLPTINFIGNGWYRITLAGIVDSTSTQGGVYLYLEDATGTTPYLGDGTGCFYLWGGQMEVGTVSTPYIPTTTTSATITDYTLTGSTLALAQTPVYGATLAWSGTYQTGPWRLMKLEQDFINGTADVTLIQN